MDTVEASNLKTILTEPTAGEDAFDAIAKDLGVEVGMFDPIEVGGPEAVRPDYYLTTMRRNANNLAISFEVSTQQSWLPLWLTQSLVVAPQPVAVVPVGLRF
jgi:zinc/manganese transport system substrate-binding protein